CEKAGSFDPDKVRAAALGLEFESPSGKRKVAENQHTWMPCFVGEIQKDGQFKIVYRHEDLIAPESYSKYLHPDGKYPAPTGGPKK
ncbi:MAG TPA: transporter substrate-binding protein, partial [Pirellulales bacterium]|nr:transporter substrate-binding protein [Pirellulales bacterium]